LAKQHGYRTAAIGTWHLGWDWPKIDDKPVFDRPIANGPTTRGFDSYFGTDVPNWPPFCFIENDRTVGIPSEPLPARLLKKELHLATRPGPALPGWKLEAILPTLGDRACVFIANAAKQPSPFLLYLPLTAPHTPLAVNAEWKGKSGMVPYADFVMETDAVIGRVLDALDKTGAAANTFVLLTSDNGCAQYIGVEKMEAQGHYPSGPLRGYKTSVWEGGHRVPFIVRWPGVAKPGSVCSQLVHQADTIRTLADILGAKLPDNAGEDSFSLVPLLKGADKPIRPHAVSCAAIGTPGVRRGDWKFIPGTKPELYNLADDIGETKNLAGEKPELVVEMKALLEKLITDGRSTPGPKQKNDVTVRRFPNKTTK
jgi:arylsulfatase A-like enzyme